LFRGLVGSEMCIRDSDYTLPLNTGQLLSIPLVIAGIYLIVKASKKSHDAV
jgi:prolipoprotein diacylglyceryltransferase